MECARERRLRAVAIVIAMLGAGWASAANASQVFFENFNALNGGLAASNYTVPGFATAPTQRVDLIQSSGGPGVNCAGGSGGCLDLESISGYARLSGLTAFSAQAGDTVTLAFDMSDSQRGAPQDRFYAGFLFNTSITGPLVLSRGGAWTGLLPPPPPTTSYVVLGDIFGPVGFQHYTLSFVAPQDMTVRIAFGGGNPGMPGPGTPAPDDAGALLDNLSLDITSPAAVPEPATWAILLLGFGGMGALLRRRRAYA